MILSIVIVNWNSKDLTIKCLDSIFNIPDFKNIKCEIILVDNFSSDNSIETVSEKYPQVKILKNNSNPGYAPAANQGMEIAVGKYILLLGNDTELLEGSLVNCIKFLDNNTKTGAVGAKLMYPDGKLQGNCKKFPTLKNAFFTYLSLNRFNRDYDMTSFNYDELMKVDQIATTFLMIRNEILKKINYFNTDYKLLYNDVDLCRKIYYSGYEIFFLPDAQVYHSGSHSTKKAGFKIRKIMYTDILRYFKNNFGIKAYTIVPILFIRLIFVSFFRKKFLFWA